METSNKEGCALCNATWGEYYREIDGDRMFFCCNICADIFENMVSEVKKRTGWKSVDHVDLNGNYSSGRECIARSGDETFTFFFRTYSDGRMMKFEER